MRLSGAGVKQKRADSKRRAEYLGRATSGGQARPHCPRLGLCAQEARGVIRQTTDRAWGLPLHLAAETGRLPPRLCVWARAGINGECGHGQGRDV